MADGVECGGRRSRIRWPKESNTMAEGDECCGCRRRIRWQKETKANHNFRHSIAASSALYIFWFLHQTTTLIVTGRTPICCISFDSYIKPQLSCCMIHSKASCISFDSYIKPQLRWYFALLSDRCISFDSYIKPQLYTYCSSFCFVVYLLIPTSNHNFSFSVLIICKLYIFWFLHQTTTGGFNKFMWSALYIFWYLHQTTTSRHNKIFVNCCISFDSYIKPQLLHKLYF